MDSESVNFCDSCVFAFVLEFRYFFFCKIMDFQLPAYRIKAICFRFVFKKVFLASAALIALQTSFVVERSFGDVYMVFFKDAFCGVVVDFGVEVDCFFKCVIRKVGELCSGAKLNFPVFYFFQNFFTCIGKLFTDEYPSDGSSKLFCNLLHRILFVDQIFDCDAFFIRSHADSAHILAQRNLTELFAFIVEYMARNFLDSKFLRCCKPSEACDNAVVCWHAEI